MLEEKSPPTVPEPQKIDVIFRGGSVTAIGVVLAFSLGFLNNWASQPGSWIPEDLAAVAFIGGGIVFQVWALAGMLSVKSLEVPVYRRIVRLFMIGLILVSIGVLVAIAGDALGYSKIWFKQ
ncbi:hypothetical protein J8I29_00445 [Labrys sp. LIt4]|uniref:Uncharacterized protein n=1 Tax=Labrys okinawensis TaxID=346911 RepID=A0A2S9Q7A0_9HYPH|nr:MULTISPECIES: hypothetical protein [Labrys]MBP0577764.1 hypothetical protein [Labrys sp. LIt4]PRH85232.1 hypothetical protein C5L14_22525 [Labrys okinawensis]